MTMCTTEVAASLNTAQPLLQPRRLIKAQEVLADRKTIPDVGGVYGWWFNAPLAGVPLDGTLERDGYRLLYVGIAPRKPSAAGSYSKSTLRKRIAGNHLGARIGSSTLRRSLSWLLKSDLGFDISRNTAGKPVMSMEDEASLTAWMGEHAAVSFVADPQPWDIEDALVQSGPALPINIDGSSHPFSMTLKALRASKLP